MECTIFKEFELDPKPSPKPKAKEIEEWWVFHVDGSSSTAISKARLILTSLEKVVMEYDLYFGFKASNNEAEYEVLVTGLNIVKDMGV